jgi:hypothetical protein
MKNRLILLFTLLANIAFAQLPCSVPATTTPSLTSKLMLCDPTSKHVTLGTLLGITSDTADAHIGDSLSVIRGLINAKENTLILDSTLRKHIGKYQTNFPDKTISTSTYTLLDSDFGHRIYFTNSGIVTLTLPTTGIRSNYWIEAFNYGTGGTGKVVLTTSGTLVATNDTIATYEQSAFIKLKDPTTWTATGSLGTATSGGGGSGAVGSGLANTVAYYPSNGTTVDDLSGNKTINRKLLTQYGDSSAVTNLSFAPIDNTDFYQAEQVPLGWGSGAMFFNFGDSFTNGDGPFLASATYRYTNTVAEKLGTTLNNLGVNSEGVFNCFKRVANAETVFPNQFSATMMIGFNDIGNNYSRAGVNRIANGHRAIISEHLLSSGVAANNGLVSTTGTWTTVTAGTYNDKASLSFSGLARQSSVAGSTLTYTSTGSNLVIGCWGSDGTTFNDGRFTVTIDGTLVTTWDPANNAVVNSQDPGRNHNALCYFNLGGGAHTVVITTLDSRPALVDYFGVLQDASRAPTMLVMGILKSTSTYYGATGVNNTIIENCNQRTIQVINEFRAQGYGIRYVEGNDNGWNPTTMISTIDNVHPNRLGHAKIAENFLRAVTRNYVPSQHSSLNLKGKHSTASSGFFASNDNPTSMAVGVTVFPTGQPVAGWTGPNVASFQSNCTSVNLGSYAAGSTVGLVAGGFTANDRKVTLTSAGVLKLQYGTSNTQVIIKDSIAANEASLSLLNNTNVELKARVTGSAKPSFSANSSAELVTSATQMVLVNSNASASIGFAVAGISDANIKLRMNGSGLLAVGHGSPTASLHLIGLQTQSLGNVPLANFVAGPYLGLAAGTDRPDIIFDLTKTNNWDVGTVALQRSVVVRPSTFTFNSPSTMTEASLWNFNGGIIAGTNATITLSNVLNIAAGAVGSGTQNSYGITVNAQTGGVNNYAARFLGGRVGIGTSFPLSRLHVNGTIRVDSMVASDSSIWASGPNGVLKRIRLSRLTSGSGVTTAAAIGASPNANGMTISGSTINLQPASASFGGVLTTGAQDIAGAKTLTGQLGLTSPTMRHFNVTGTNFEAFDHTWSSNFYSIEPSAGGTGTLRDLLIGGTSIFLRNQFGTAVSVSSTSLTGYLTATQGLGTPSTSAIGIIANSSNTSGVTNQLSILPSISTSATGGQRMIWVSPYLNSTGSGVNYLMDLGTNTASSGAGTHTSKFSVDNTGNVNLTGNITNSTTVFTVRQSDALLSMAGGSVNNMTIKLGGWTSGAGYTYTESGAGTYNALIGLSGDKSLSVSELGTTISGVTKSNSDIAVTDNTKGFVLKDSAGACWRLTVAPTTGVLGTTSITCP